MTAAGDPFDTTGLRARVLRTWADSPGRFREDANAEEDLRLGGYRDRWLVELAANAADAAGEGGRMRVSLVGDELRIANTGTPLDAAGVAALASLRASTKRAGAAVGRFGVGFAAVLAISEEPSITSVSGGVRFSAAATREALAGLPAVRDELARRGGAVPVLRLAWPECATPPDGYTTEVRLPLRAGVAAETLLAEADAQVPDLLLALPGLDSITVSDRRWWAERRDRMVLLQGPGTTSRWLLHRERGTLRGEQLRGLGVEARQRPEFGVCWAVSVDEAGTPVRLTGEVLHAPTPTGERLSLPVRLLADLPLEPGRRRAQPSEAAAAVLDAAAAAYPRLLATLPAGDRPALLPEPGFPVSEVDGALVERVTAALRGAAWLPTAAGGEVAPGDACVLRPATPALTELLAEVLPGLLPATYSRPEHATRLSALDVRAITPAAVADALAGIERPPQWWASVYAALAEFGSQYREQLSGLPVPLADGRTVLGPRHVLLPTPELSELLAAGTDAVDALRVAAPEAVHPLLERLGARRASPADVLASPQLADAVSRSVTDARAGMDAGPLARLVLSLVRMTGADALRFRWLPELALPDAGGGHAPAAELLVPDAALLAVLDPEVVGEELGVLSPAMAARWPREVLTATGVLDGFAVVADEEPAGPDHDLADEAGWWSAIGGDSHPPARLLAVRDLDLVADDRWPEALRMLAAGANTWRALTEPGGYTGWWLARYAVLAGAPPASWRLPDVTELAGLYDPVPDTGLPRAVLLAAGVRDRLAVSGTGEVAELLARLGDPQRPVPAGVALRVHTLLAAAVTAGDLDPASVAPPDRVRTLAGVAVPAGTACVVDGPWLLPVVPAAEAVAATPGADPAALADLLDLPLAGERPAGMLDDGEAVAWSEMGAVRAACELLATPVPAGAVLVHDTLRVNDQPVRWWVAGNEVHAEDTAAGLGRALAWSLQRWQERNLIIALLDDPDALTLLG